MRKKRLAAESLLKEANENIKRLEVDKQAYFPFSSFFLFVF